MSGGAILPPMPIGRGMLRLAAVAGAGLAVALAGLGIAGRWEQFPPAMTAAAAAMIGAAVGLLPAWASVGRPVAQAAPAAMAGMAARPLATGLVVALGILAIPLPPASALGWALGFYLLLLGVEVTVLVRWMNG